MNINDYSSFYEARENYLNELDKFLKNYNIPMFDYLKKVQEENISKINNPKNEKELGIAIKCLEIISKCYEYANNRNLKNEDNLSYTFFNILIKGTEDNKYFDVAQDYMDTILSDPILYGNFLVDSNTSDISGLERDFFNSKQVFNKTSALKSLFTIAIQAVSITLIASKKEKEKENSYLIDIENKMKNKDGAEKFAESYDLVFGYLKQYENQQNMPDTFAMTYRRRFEI